MRIPNVELLIYAHDWPAQNTHAGDPGGAFRLFRPTHARCGPPLRRGICDGRGRAR